MKAKEFNKKIVSLQPMLLSKARQMTSCFEEAEDLVQETFLKLWTIREQLTAHPNAEALAMRTLHNMAIDNWRHQQREKEMLKDQILSSEERSVSLTGDTSQLIERIVESLPHLQQQVFRLKDLEGYTTKEITLITGCTEANLRKNLSRARTRIRDEYLRITKPENR